MEWEDIEFEAKQATNSLKRMKVDHKQANAIEKQARQVREMKDEYQKEGYSISEHLALRLEQQQKEFEEFLNEVKEQIHNSGLEQMTMF